MQKSRRLTHNYNHFYVNCLHFKTHFLWRIISSWVAMQKKGQWNDQKKKVKMVIFAIKMMTMVLYQTFKSSLVIISIIYR